MDIDPLGFPLCSCQSIVGTQWCCWCRYYHLLRWGCGVIRHKKVMKLMVGCRKSWLIKVPFYYITIYLPIVTICFTGGSPCEASNQSKS